MFNKRIVLVICDSLITFCISKLLLNEKQQNVSYRVSPLWSSIDFIVQFHRRSNTAQIANRALHSKKRSSEMARQRSGALN